MGIPFWTQAGTIDLAALRPQDMTAKILGDTLAKINRHGGRTPEPFSVAAHLVLVEQICDPDLRPWALLHRAHEAYLGDMISPAVELLCQCGTKAAVGHAIQNAKGKLDRTIAAAWGVAVRSMSEGLRRADNAACLAEAWHFIGVRPGILPPAEVDLLDRAMSGLAGLPAGDWRAARDLWLTRVEFYAKLGLLSPPRSDDPASAVLAG